MGSIRHRKKRNPNVSEKDRSYRHRSLALTWAQVCAGGGSLLFCVLKWLLEKEVLPDRWFLKMICNIMGIGENDLHLTDIQHKALVALGWVVPIIFIFIITLLFAIKKQRDDAVSDIDHYLTEKIPSISIKLCDKKVSICEIEISLARMLLDSQAVLTSKDGIRSLELWFYLNKKYDQQPHVYSDFGFDTISTLVELFVIDSNYDTKPDPWGPRLRLNDSIGKEVVIWLRHNEHFWREYAKPRRRIFGIAIG